MIMNGLKKTQSKYFYHFKNFVRKSISFFKNGQSSMYMKTLFVKLQAFYKILPLIFFIILTILFFWKFFFKGLVPIPVDFAVGTYFPWLDYKWGGFGAGVPVKNPLLADVPSLIYPIRILAMDIFKNGEFPLWNRLQFAGYPLMATFQAAVFNPFNILFFFFENHIAWSIEVIIQPLLSLSFTYLFLRSLGIKRISSMFGSIIYAFSGFNTIWLTYGIHGFVASMIPLLLFLVNKIILTKKLYWGVFFSFSLALQIFFGYPQLTIYTIILIAAWTFVRDYKKTAQISAFGILGIFLASVQLLPGYELLKNSQRLIEGVSGGDSVAFLQFNQLLNLLIPDFYGNPSTYNYWGSGNYTNLVGYSGVVALTLALATFLKQPKNSAVIFFKIVFFSTLILALPTPIKLGAATATRILVLFNLSVAVLAAFGFEFIKKNKFNDFWKLSFFVFILLLTIFAAVYYRVWEVEKGLVFYLNSVEFSILDKWKLNLNISLRNTIFPILVSFSLLVTYLIWKRFKVKQAIYFIFILTIFELFRFGWKFTPFSDPILVYPSTPIFDKLIEKKDDRFRIAEGDTIPISMWMPFNLQALSGYDAVYPLTIAKYISVINSNNPKAAAMGRYGSVENFDSKLFDLANIQYAFVLKRNNLGVPDEKGLVSYKYRNPKFRKVFEDKSVAILENVKSLPRIFFVSKWQIIKNDQENLTKLISPEFDLRNEIILSDDFSEFEKSDNLPTYEVKNIEYKENSLKLDINSDQDGFLFVSDTYYPGWEVYIDDNLENIYRADFAFRAVPVAKGEHNILFIYRPKSFRIGKFVTLSTFLILLIILIYEYKKNR